jgi:hypothetical protein
VTKHYAYSFRSRLDLAEMMRRLNELGPWTWQQRDRDSWGDYLLAVTSESPYGGNAKIICEPNENRIARLFGERFVLNIKLSSDEGESDGARRHFARVRDTLLCRQLPIIGARLVWATEYLE